MAVTVIRNRQAFHQFHHQVGSPARDGAAVEQMCDIRMIEAGEDLPFIPEALNQEPGIVACTEQFDGNLLAVLIIGAERAIHFTHSADSDLLDGLVGTDTLADLRSFLPPADIGKEIRPGILICRNQVFQILAEGWILRAHFIEILGPLVRLQLQRHREQSLHLLPTLRSHRALVLAVSWRNHARAVAHSRLTVAGEIAKTRAASSIESPAKKRSSTICDCRRSSAASAVSASSRAIRSTLCCRGRATASSRSSVSCPPPR